MNSTTYSTALIPTTGTRNPVFCAFVFTALLTLSSAAHAQQQNLDTLRHRFETYRITHTTEKIYTHLDQELYLTGEMLWFKLYVVDGSLHRPTAMSKVAYVEILDRDNRPVLQTKINLQDGMGNGSLFLPASIQSGRYRIRAYTNWMKNFSQEFFFEKSVTIVNTFRKLEQDSPVARPKPDAQFFPEGGHLVSGIKSKVAFRVISAMGMGIDFRGLILNQNQDTIAIFRPLKFGMGSFYMTPTPGETYRAVIEDEHGQRSNYVLPEIQNHGYVLSVTDSTEHLLTISVQSQPDSPGPVYLFAHTRNMVTKATVLNMQRGTARVVVDKRDLPEGISHVTLFDSSLQPLCERLYFIPVRKRMDIKMTLNQQAFGLRRKASVTVQTQDESGQPVSANLSVAVFRVDSLQQQSESSMLSYFWLSADLMGPIESPEYYMQPGADVRQAIDHVMLTHGWRRFAWNDILKDHPGPPDYLPEVRGHIIRGNVTEPSGAPAMGVRTYLSAPSRNIQIYGSISNARGEVNFEVKDFRGPRKIIAQTNNLLDSTLQIKILSPFADVFSSRPLPPFNLPAVHEKQLVARSIAMQVQDVFYQERSNKFKITTEDSTAFYGKADATYLLDDYTRFPVMEEVMREYVPGVMVRKRKSGFRFMTLDNVNKGVFDEDPMILLDGIPLFDVDDIMAFDPLLVKKLEILNRRYYMGILSMPGIVSYTTYSGDLAGYQLDPRCVVLDYEGLQLQREFYVPKYDTKTQRDTRMPDQRSLLLWDPHVNTGKDGTQHVEFFTSDLPGEYIIEIQGLTRKGLAGKGTAAFTVQHYDN